MRVLVCGGRDFHDIGIVWSVLSEIDRTNHIDLVISGGARGADQLGYAWAIGKSRGALQFFADWDKYGRAAGPLRNQRMLDEGAPDLIIAFPGGRGTADMVQRAKAARVKVIEVPPSTPPQK